MVGGHSNAFLYNGDVTPLVPEKDSLGNTQRATKFKKSSGKIACEIK